MRLTTRDPQFRSSRKRLAAANVPRRHDSTSNSALLVHARLRPRTARAIASLSVFAAPALASAQSRAPSDYPSVLTYRTVRIADGIYAFITPEERSSFQAGNSIAIIGDDGVLVFDTGNIPSATRAQIAEIRRLTPKPVRWVVNSHWHPDHTLGNAEYRKAFPGVTVIGTSATRFSSCPTSACCSPAIS